MSVGPALVIVGAGPRGTGLIERIAANAPELYEGRRLDIHLVDPYPPGGGRIWRHDQSPLLWMNSMAEDVTMFTDDTVQQEGPIRPGPALHAWAADVRDGRVTRSRTGTPRTDTGARRPGLSEQTAAERLSGMGVRAGGGRTSGGHHRA